MTAVHLIWFASLAGALTFFAAGGATVLLCYREDRAASQGRADAVEATHLQAIQQRDAAYTELARLRDVERAHADELARLRHAAERSDAAFLDERSTIVQPVREAELGRQRAEAAERELASVRERAEREAAALRTRAEVAAREAGALRARIDAAEAELGPLRKAQQQLSADLERTRAEAVAARATIDQLRAPAERSKQLASDLERARTETTALRGELEQLEARLGEAGQQLAERVQTVRDLAQENEQLKGRLQDAENLRGEYVRLRTAATETAFLKSEVARLEGELRALKIEALGGKPRRPARGSGRALTQPTQRSIGESLSSVIERFTDSGTRSVAIADPAGFPLASNGEDGQALAAYAALLLDSASRAGQFLPVAAPSTVEIVDHSGARISVWTFDVDGERLCLANLAVAPAEPARVETALADLVAILAPTPLAKTTAT